MVPQAPAWTLASPENIQPTVTADPMAIDMSFRRLLIAKTDDASSIATKIATVTAECEQPVSAADRVTTMNFTCVAFHGLSIVVWLEFQSNYDLTSRFGKRSVGEGKHQTGSLEPGREGWPLAVIHTRILHLTILRARSPGQTTQQALQQHRMVASARRSHAGWIALTGP